MDSAFEMKSRQQVERLNHYTCREIEREVAQKRIEWFQKNNLRAGKDGAPTPRRAYEMLFFDYEVVEKSPAMVEVIGGVLHDQCMLLYQ